MPKQFGLSRRERLRADADFDRLFQLRQTSSDASLVVFAAPNQLSWARVGLAVARKWGKAHVRNRIHRLLREAFRLSKPQIPTGYDYILLPRKIEGLTLRQLLQSVPRLAARAAARCQRELAPPASLQPDADATPAPSSQGGFGGQDKS
ncbi:Ribonuclease P protein component [bacterium HR36]|nr:Ribonuclease P protein component [bacterium HR36]